MCKDFIAIKKKKKTIQFAINFIKTTVWKNPKFIGPTSGRVVTLETGRRGVPGSNPGRACRPSRSEFSVVFSETRVNTG